MHIILIITLKSSTSFCVSNNGCPGNGGVEVWILLMKTLLYKSRISLHKQSINNGQYLFHYQH